MQRLDAVLVVSCITDVGLLLYSRLGLNTMDLNLAQSLQELMY